MMRSLYSGVAGLKNHQTRMDVVGNNIANVNTVGYKAGRTTFQDMLSQTVKGAASATGNTGGVNPLQVGLGMGVASVDNIFTTGSMQSTGKNTDLGINGDGFFMVKSGNEIYYTRAGNFDFDADGNYVIPGTGLQVMGWLADASGIVNTSGAAVPITIPLNTAMPPKVTSLISYDGNLNSDKPVGETSKTDIMVYDSMGIGHSSNTTFTKLDNYAWQVDFDVEGANGGPYSGIVVFDDAGKYLYDTFSNQDITVKGANKFAVTPVGAGTPDIPTTGGPGGTNTFTVTNTVTTPQGPVTVTTVVTYPDTPAPDVTFMDPKGNVYTYDDVNNEYTDVSSGTVYRYNNAAGVNRWEVHDGVAFTGVAMPGGGANPPTAYYSFTDPATSTSVSVTGSTACVFQPVNGAADMTVAPDLKGLSQYGIETNAQAKDQDGYTAGTLKQATLSVDADGTITGQFSNDEIMTLGRVALALFTNPGGLTKVGNSLFAKSNNSGVPRVGVPNQGGYGKLMPGNLELSNVDLSEEFTSMITTQRGFQANSRIITTSDTMLEELINLKR